MRRLSHEQGVKQVFSEFKDRAVRMLLEHGGEYLSLWAGVESIALKIGWMPQTLLGWVQRHKVDTDARAGATRSDAQRMKELVGGEHRVALG